MAVRAVQRSSCLPGSGGPSAGTNTPHRAHVKTLEALNTMATLPSSAGQGHCGGARAGSPVGVTVRSWLLIGNPTSSQSSDSSHTQSQVPRLHPRSRENVLSCQPAPCPAGWVTLIKGLQAGQAAP